MANPGAEDVPAMFGDLGVAFTVGSKTTMGHFNRQGVRILPGEGMAAASGIERVGEIPAGSLDPDLVRGADITIDGDPYKVARIEPVDDGAVTHVTVIEP